MSKINLLSLKEYLFSLCLAILTYLFYILIINNDEKYFTVPIYVEYPINYASSSEVLTSVTVTVRGSPASLARVSREDMTVVLDVSDVQQEGIVSQELELRRSNTFEQITGLEITITPPSIDVFLEERLTRDIAIEHTFTNSLPRGYLFKGVRINPSNVGVSGPHSIISTIEKISTVEIDISSFVRSSTRIVPLKLPKFTVLESLENNEVKVFTTIQEVIVVQTFHQIPVEVNNIDENLFLAQNDIFVDLVVQGPQLIIEKLSPKVFVDVFSLHTPGEFGLDFQINVPNGIEIISSEPKQVKILLARKKTNNVSDKKAEEVIPQFIPSPSLIPVSPEYEFDEPSQIPSEN